MLTLVQRVGAVRTFLAVLSHDNRQIAQLLQHINLAVGEGGFKGKAFPGVFVQLDQVGKRSAIGQSFSLKRRFAVLRMGLYSFFQSYFFIVSYPPFCVVFWVDFGAFVPLCAR